jgi:type I restriction enzyme, S subunit
VTDPGDGWRTPPLGALVHAIVPGRAKPDELSGPIPWLRIEDFEGKYIATSKSGQGVTPEQLIGSGLKVFPKGTVVCTCSCDMGTTAIVRKPLITNQTFIGLHPRDERLSPEFLYYSLRPIARI